MQIKGNASTFYDFTRQNHFHSRLSTRIAVKSNKKLMKMFWWFRDSSSCWKTWSWSWSRILSVQNTAFIIFMKFVTPQKMHTKLPSILIADRRGHWEWAPKAGEGAQTETERAGSGWWRRGRSTQSAGIDPGEICTDMSTCMCTYVHACMHAYICIHVHTYEFAYIRILLHSCKHTDKHTHTYVHTCVHMCIYVSKHTFR